MSWSVIYDTRTENTQDYNNNTNFLYNSPEINSQLIDSMYCLCTLSEWTISDFTRLQSSTGCANLYLRDQFRIIQIKIPIIH